MGVYGQYLRQLEYWRKMLPEWWEMWEYYRWLRDNYLKLLEVYRDFFNIKRKINDKSMIID